MEQLGRTATPHEIVWFGSFILQAAFQGPDF